MYSTDATYDLLKKLNNTLPLLWEIQVRKPGGDEFYGIQFEATEAELLSALLDLNAELNECGLVMLESFLYAFDVHPEDMQRAYAYEYGWSLQCYDCHGATNIGYDVEHEIRGNQVVFIWSFDPEPVNCIMGCQDNW